jgi:hypothetical protein
VSINIIVAIAGICLIDLCYIFAMQWSLCLVPFSVRFKYSTQDHVLKHPQCTYVLPLESNIKLHADIKQNPCVENSVSVVANYSCH